MTTKETKDFVRRYLAALSGQDKPAATVDEYAADEELKRHIALFEAAFPRYEIIADEMIAEDDKVALRARFQGRHDGDLMGIAATGKQVVLPFIIIYRLANGKIEEHWMSINQLDLIKQLGVIEQ